MGLRNFLGLGILFGAKDDGLEKKQKGITDQFHQMSEAVKDLNKLVGLNRISTFVQALNLDKLNEISSKIEHIGHSGLNLTTGFEAKLTHMAKAAREVGLNYGYTGKALSKFSSAATGMGIALNLGSEETSQAIRAWDQAGSSLRALGFEGAKDIAKFAAATHTHADSIMEATRQMDKEFGFTRQSISGVMSSMVKFGQVSGDVSGTLERVPELLSKLSQKAALAGRNLDQAQLADWGKQVAGVATALRRTVPNSAKALEIAMNIASTMATAEQEIGNLFAGTANDLPAFTVELGIAQGDIQKSFDAMRKGPAEFLAGLTEMMLKAKEAGKDTNEVFNFLRARLEAASLPPDQVAVMMNFLRTATKETVQMTRKTVDAQVNFKKLAQEGFSTGRTLEDRFTLAHDLLVTKFRSIGKTAAEVFVTDSGKQFNEFGNTLTRIAKEQGPLGLFIKKMSQMHQIGALALIPKTLRPMAALFGSIAKESVPVVAALGALGLRFSTIFHPLVLLIAGFTTLALLLKASGHNAAAQRKDFDRMKVWIHGVAETIRDFGRNLPKLLMEMWAFIKEFGPIIGPPLLEAFRWAFDMVLHHVLPFVADLIKGIFEGLSGQIQRGGSEIHQIGTSIGDALQKAFHVALDYVSAYLKVWWGNVADIMARDNLTFTEKMKKIFSESGVVIASAMALAIFTPVFSIAGTLLRIVIPILVTLAKSVVPVFKVLRFLGSMIVPTFSLIIRIFSLLFNTVGTVIRVLMVVGELLMPVFVMIGEGIVSVVAGIFSIKAAIVVAVAAIAALIVGLLFWPEKTKDILAKVWDGLKRGFWAMVNWLKTVIFVTIPMFFKNFYDNARAFGRELLSILLHPVDAIERAWKSLQGSLGKIFDRITEMAKKAMFWKASAETASVSSPTPAPVPAPTNPTRTPSPAPQPVAASVAISSSDSTVMQALNMPVWYVQYEKLFIDRMDRLTRAVQASKSGAVSRAPSRTGTKAAAENGTNLYVATGSNGLPTTTDMEGE